MIFPSNIRRPSTRFIYKITLPKRSIELEFYIRYNKSVHIALVRQYHMSVNKKNVITIIYKRFKPAAEGPKGTKALANEGPFLLFF